MQLQIVCPKRASLVHESFFLCVCLLYPPLILRTVLFQVPVPLHGISGVSCKDSISTKGMSRKEGMRVHLPVGLRPAEENDDVKYQITGNPHQGKKPLSCWKENHLKGQSKKAFDLRHIEAPRNRYFNT